jgi:hypothetical protein
MRDENFWKFHNFLLSLFCWEDACQQHTVQNIIVFKRMKEEQGLLLQPKQLWMLQGLNPWLHGERLAPKPLNHEDLYILRASFFHLAELATSEFWLNLHHSSRPKPTFVKYVSLIYEPGATKLMLFFSSTVSPKMLSLTGCKMWSANP